ncbi:MFS transporter [Dermatophilaceae bacterium Sec6.4]
MKQMFHDSVWQVRDFRRLALGRSVAAAGTGLVTVVQLLRAHGGGPDVIMLLLLAEAIPPILFAGLIGQIADRRDSRSVLAIGIAAQTAACLLLATNPNLALTCAAMACLSAGAALSGPIWMVLVPMVVGERRVGAAIGGQQALRAALAPLGAGAGGLLFSGVGTGVAMLVSTACYLQLGVVALRLGVRRRGEPGVASTPSSSVRSRLQRSLVPDLSLLRRDRFVWRLTLSVVPLIVVVQGVNVLEVLLARNDIGVSAAQFGASEVAAGVGAVLGAGVAGRVVGAQGRGWSILGGFGACSAAIGALGATRTVGWYFALLVIVGFGAGVANACFGALFIGRTPAAERGRVSASINGLMLTAATSSIALGGVCGVLIGVRASFVAAGLAGLAVLAVAAAFLPRTPTTAHTPSLTPAH